MCREAGEEGWWGTWAEVAFNVSQTAPFLTTPRNIARIEAVNVCNRPIQLFNQFQEYLVFGNGRLPKLRPSCGSFLRAVYTRNNVPTFVDLTNPPQFIAVYATNPVDIQAAKRVLIQGPDQNNNTVYTQDGTVQVNGQFLTLESPFVSTPMSFNSITGIQKDPTQGPVQFFQLDPISGAQILLLTMEPSETTASYRRYFFDRLPFDCCGAVVAPGMVTVTALCKLDPIRLQVDTDYFTLQGDAAIEAIIHECQAVRYHKMDDAVSKSMAKEHHSQAVGILNGILNQYIGQESVAVRFSPFGSAKLSRKHVGML